MRINEMDSLPLMRDMLERITEGVEGVEIKLSDDSVMGKVIIIAKRENGIWHNWHIR